MVPVPYDPADPSFGATASPAPYSPRASDSLTALDILEKMPDGIVVAAHDGRVTFVNPRAEVLLGARAQDLLGTPVQTAVPLLVGSGTSWWECIDPWGGLSIRTGHRERLLLLPGLGHVLVTMTYVRQYRGGPVHRVIVALRDTEARRRAEAGVAELISTVAHELRSPLASVRGFSRSLLGRWERFTDDDKRLMVTTIESEAQRLSRLVAELLDVSRLDVGRLRLAHTLVDIPERVRIHRARLAASGYDLSGFALHVRAADGQEAHEPLLAWADADRIDQVIGNLLDNAVIHGSGGVHVVVTALGTETGPATARGVEVSVRDEGPGILPEHAELVFAKFWHGNRRGSTGLGLYLARGIVEAHGGVLTLVTAAGSGARFTFTLPPPRPDSGEHLGEARAPVAIVRAAQQTKPC